MYQHLRYNSGRWKNPTPDRARVLACWTVLIAARRGEVLNGQERGLQDCFLGGDGIGRHAAGPRRERALEEKVWRRISARTEFKGLETFGHGNDIAEKCHRSPKSNDIQDNYAMGSRCS